MATLPPPTHTTVAAIWRHYERHQDDGFRAHLGASVIGGPCSRAHWYTFRWCTPANFEGRMLRLFDTGSREEPRFIGELRAIGVEVHDRNPDTGRQFVVSEHGGHFGGSLDGCALGLPERPAVWHVLEFKTHSAKSFAALEKQGVREAKPAHYAQMQVYMGLTGMTRALYLAKNKDTDALYGERVRFDEAEFLRLRALSLHVITAPEPLARIGKDASWWQCKQCSHTDVCHGPALPAVNCRTCLHATPELDGDARWSCARHRRDLSVEDQRRACPQHLYIPALIGGMEPVDAGDDWVEYANKRTGELMRNGVGGHDSEDLRRSA